MTAPLKKKPPLSAYIRTKNEARMIGQVITAALAVADEVVVVDSGSTDNTPAIAEAAGAKVVHHEWLGYGFQKNIAENNCRNDWLLDLDADEIISIELASEIASLFANGEPSEGAFRTPMIIDPPVGEPWDGFGGIIRHKLYDRRVVRSPAHKAWDQFSLPAGVKIGKLTVPIVHHAFKDTTHLIDKLNQSSTTFARDLKPKSEPYLILRIFFGLPFYVFKRYILDGLFRGGVYGFAFSMMSGFGRWIRDVKMYERIHHTKDNNGST